ncbi:bifunctional alpha/beta hydrolase/OsmC family protein [Pseudoalteromonas obscura]|uniref:Bifunctional alpha/beta hydrolase/OsmC family protein n=1 Tax=Pseudoalteromonas obscura TaxID=3048491 RepID=A0ABT7EGI0_9GAMM|nr:bifunctional alpha/beta hydrolase/OsmC family protein [Pseudoalteromonas sp. P94(2023)]MDK2594157.1 bifunctional alpha/beta hydrolase/OsmC family protein [Pseudoalteromonas sp. P94(2023)]
MREKVEFISNGNTLAGLLERPSDHIKAVALFAHCFTCTKDIAAASRISRALVKEGYAVLRFDFTGLGNSDGDFANSNFSSNLDDLYAAADYLRHHFHAQQILIGHSLGGAAVLAAANQIEEVSAVVTIGAPANAQHVVHNFSAHIDQINQTGEAQVQLGLRTFHIKKQFLDDLAAHKTQKNTVNKKALLVMHSPIDDVVSIEQAEAIYTDAKHPKSFISLDNADHLLSKANDAEYAATAISGWVSKYVSHHLAPETQPVANGELVVSEQDHKFTLTVSSDSHTWLADEPTSVGGKNFGPDPYEHLLAALGTCTVMTMRMYANYKKLPVKDIKVTLRHQKSHHQDCDNCDNNDSFAEHISRDIELEGELTSEQKQKLLSIADKCPVHKTLHNEIRVTTELKNTN